MNMNRAFSRQAYLHEFQSSKSCNSSATIIVLGCRSWTIMVAIYVVWTYFLTGVCMQLRTLWWCVLGRSGHYLASQSWIMPLLILSFVCSSHFFSQQAANFHHSWHAMYTMPLTMSACNCHNVRPYLLLVLYCWSMQQSGIVRFGIIRFRFCLASW